DGWSRRSTRFAPRPAAAGPRRAAGGSARSWDGGTGCRAPTPLRGGRAGGGGGAGAGRPPAPMLALGPPAAVMAGCTGAGDGEPASQAPAVAEGLTELGRGLPQGVPPAREIRVGSDISFAPVEFYDAFAPDVLDRPVREPEPQVRGIDPD